MTQISLILTFLITTLLVVVKTETTLECLKDKMKITFDSVNDVDVYTLLNSTSANCSPNVTATVIEIVLHDCGTETELNNTHIIYKNTLTGSKDATAIINRGAKIMLFMRCSYDRIGNTTVTSYTAGQSTVDLEGEGIFTFKLDAYGTFSANALGTMLTSPFLIDLQETIYFQISLDAPNDLSLAIAIVHIIAMDTTDMDAVGANKYYIVKDGCSQDSTYNEVFPTGISDMEKAFSVEAFNFVSDGSAAIYIHGVVTLCHENDAESCGQLCEVRRKKREVALDGNFNEEFSVYGGPFIVKVAEETTSEGFRGTVSGFLVLLGQLTLMLL